MYVLSIYLFISELMLILIHKLSLIGIIICLYYFIIDIFVCVF